MTEQEVRQFVVDTAKKYIGYKESDGTHKIIIDGYNKHKPLAKNYKVTYKDSWCATFVSFVAIKCGYTDIMFTECSCPRMIDLYKNAGRWIEDDSYIPKIGDIIMYDWDDNGKGDDIGNPDHVGIVVSVNGKDIKVIEGNKNDSVSYRDMKINGKYIRGYCVPDYSKKVTSEPKKVIYKIFVENADIDVPTNKDEKYIGKYKVTADLNLRVGAGTNKKIMTVIPKDTYVSSSGFYSIVNKTIWQLILFDKDGVIYTGYASSNYLTK